MTKHVALFTLNLFISLCKISSCINDYDQKSLIQCAAEVANTNFNNRIAAVILFKDVEIELVSDFIKRYKGTVTIETKNVVQPTEQAVIILNNYQSFTKLLRNLNPEVSSKNLFNGKAKYIVILNSNPKKLHHITRILWSYFVTNIVIIVQDKKERVALYTYFLYKNHLDCQNTDPTLIGYWEDVKVTDIYPDKLRNMQECPLYISTSKIYHQATEQDIPLQMTKKAIVRLLRYVMNFTPVITNRDYVSIDSDRAKNWSDSLNDVITGSANISTCTIPLGIDGLGLLDYSFPYFRVRLAWLAPPVTSGPAWWRLVTPLHSYLWLILLLVTFFLISLPFVSKLGHIRKFCVTHFKYFNKVQGAAFRVWGVMLGQTIRVAPKRFRDFYIISIWLWFTFVVRNAYQSVLIGALKTETLVGNFANLRKTIDYGYAFGGRAGIYAYFEFDPLIRNNFEIIPEQKFEEMFQNVINGNKKFVIAASLEYALANCLSQGKRENECGHVLPDSILTVPLVVWMNMNSPFARSLDVWLPRLLESGLLQRDSSTKTSSLTTVSSDPSPLTFHQTLSCFLCLICGIAISVVVFIFEALRNYTSMYTVVKRTEIKVHTFYSEQ